jgi:hypothetical protein
MSLPLYIDNEVPGLAEWDQVVQSAQASVQQTVQASFPERGQLGLRVITDGSDNAYALKTLGTLSASQVRYVGVWVRVNVIPGVRCELVRCAATVRMFGLLLVGTQLVFTYLYSPGAERSVFLSYDLLGRWVYLAVAVARASNSSAADGWTRLYINGREVVSVVGLRNYSGSAGSWNLLVGHPSGIGHSEADFDEIKAQDGFYPAPHVPACPDDTLTPPRVVVVYSYSHIPSRDFADQCVSRLGIPRANLLDIPYPGSSETLESYSAMQQAYEAPIQAFFDLHPAVWANNMCFLVSPHLPNSFLHNGLTYCVASRLMSFGKSFQPGRANPIFSLPAGQRLRKADLQGHFLACQVDGPTAGNLLDSGLDPIVVAPNHRLVGTSEAYRESLECAALRIDTAPLPDVDQPIEADALTWADRSGLLFGTGAERVVLASTAANSASPLRTSGSDAYAAFQAAYQAVLGSAGPAQAFDAPRFLQMLRSGGTFAEAAAVASPCLDSSAAAIGNPLLAAVLPKGGINIYRGLSDLAAVDWDAPAALLRPGQTQAQIALDLPSDQVTVLAARRVSDQGIEERSTHVAAYVRADAEGQICRPVLSRAVDLSARLSGLNHVDLRFAIHLLTGECPPQWLDVLADGGTGQLNLDEPVASVAYQAGRSEYVVNFAATPAPRMLAVRARRDGQVGPLSVPLRLPEDVPSPPVLL